MTPDEATRELYKTLHINKRHTKYEDVKLCIDAGARLTGIESAYGLPIMLAMDVFCDFSIIQLLADSGGADFSYKNLEFNNLYYSKPEYNKYHCELSARIEKYGYEYVVANPIDDDKTYMYCDGYACDINFVTYKSIINDLIFEYHYINGLSKIWNIVYDELVRQKHEPLECQIYIPDNFYHIDVEPQQKRIEYLKGCCKIFKINYEDLATLPYELPPNMKDFENIPDDDKPYNWSFERDYDD